MKRQSLVLGMAKYGVGITRTRLASVILSRFLVYGSNGTGCVGIFEVKIMLPRLVNQLKYQFLEW